MASGAVGPYQPYGTPDGLAEEAALKATLDPALNAYKSANGGKEPSNPTDLQPYLTTHDQQAALEQVIALMNQAQTVKYGANFRDSTVQPNGNKP